MTLLEPACLAGMSWDRIGGQGIRPRPPKRLEAVAYQATASSGMDCPGPDGLALASGRAALGGYPGLSISALTSFPAGLACGAWAPARSARLTWTAAIVMMRAISMIPADTWNPRPKPTDSAWS